MLEAIARALYFWVAVLDSGWFLIVAVLVAISAVYLFSSGHLTRIGRVVTSAHGVLFALAFSYAALVGSVFVEADGAWIPYPFVALMALGIGSVVLSVWNLRKRVFLHSVHALTLSYAFIVLYRGAGIADIGHHTANCWLPNLVLDVPSRVLVHVGDRADRASDSCPVPVARLIQVQRPYGELEFELWGSPHRLYMVGRLEDGSALRINGDQVEPYRPKSPSWLDKYSHRRTFLGDNFGAQPESVAFSVAVLDSRGETLDELRLVYRPEFCTCRGGD